MTWHPDMPDEFKNQIVMGDAHVLTTRIPDNSIDLVFTDPPYQKEYLPLYLWLAETAARILKDSGFLLTYTGGYWKDKVFEYLGQHLAYFWDYTLLMNASSIMWQRKTVARGKSLLAYHKTGCRPLPRVNVLGVWGNGHADKAFHEWGQDEETARYYIDCFSAEDDIVLDPFCGGGTTPVVCKLLNRHFIAFDIDDEAVEMTRKRLEGFRPRARQSALFVPQPIQEEMGI